jgi:hypothetical protein
MGVDSRGRRSVEFAFGAAQAVSVSRGVLH